ncbi:hypothetical protein [Propionicicella superfundia]|uniref:hypothetical protein n=1 Tax=Propionicicella superfundia TaxID=348582 RepID=UPI0004103201|nr:hypothetical protein [Propionicicella superfundia]
MLGRSRAASAIAAAIRPGTASLCGVEVAVPNAREATRFLSGGLLYPLAAHTDRTMWFGQDDGAAVLGARLEAGARRGVNGTFFRLLYATPGDLAIVLASVGVNDPQWLVDGVRAHRTDTFLLSACDGVRVEISAPAPDDRSVRLDADEYLAEHLTDEGRAVVTACATGVPADRPASALTRVALHLRDLRDAVSFFGDVLGFRQQQARPNGVVMTNGAQVIDLQRTRRRVYGPAGLSFGVEAPEQLAAVADAVPPATCEQRDNSVRITGPEGLRVTACLIRRPDSGALLRELIADS